MTFHFASHASPCGAERSLATLKQKVGWGSGRNSKPAPATPIPCARAAYRRTMVIGVKDTKRSLRVGEAGVAIGRRKISRSDKGVSRSSQCGSKTKRAGHVKETALNRRKSDYPPQKRASQGETKTAAQQGRETKTHGKKMLSVTYARPRSQDQRAQHVHAAHRKNSSARRAARKTDEEQKKKKKWTQGGKKKQARSKRNRQRSANVSFQNRTDDRWEPLSSPVAKGVGSEMSWPKRAPQRAEKRWLG
jgi:hypothetical protein